VETELLKYHLMMKKSERISGKIVKKSIGNEENISCEREFCRNVDMALSFSFCSVII
jgi:hypothetical protein